LDEVRAAFAAYPDRYMPILTLAEAAELTGLTPATLRRQVSEGRFKGGVRRRKPLRFWRDRFIQQFMRFGR
jgi:predicted TIM-barrel fold metal-dependent hydrolase